MGKHVEYAHWFSDPQVNAILANVFTVARLATLGEQKMGATS
jgi:hypothetical protein